MPYKSKAQQGFMHAAADRGDISKSVVKDFDKGTSKKQYESLPSKKGDKAPAHNSPDDSFPFHNTPNDGGADGSHENSQDQLGGARKHFHDTSPDEQASFYKGKPR
jgi:hypothetical protein